MGMPVAVELHSGAVDAYYLESQAAAKGLDDLLKQYRSNTATVLTLATGAATFFGFSDTPKGNWYLAALGAYALATILAATIFWPLDWQGNPASETGPVFMTNGAQLNTTKTKYDFGCTYQDIYVANRQKIRSRYGVARRFIALIVTTGLVVIFAGFNVIASVGDKTPTITRVQIVEG